MLYQTAQYLTLAQGQYFVITIKKKVTFKIVQKTKNLI